MIASPKQRQGLKSTFPHLYVNLKFFIPIGVPYTALEKIAIPFTVVVWILIVLIFAIVCHLFKVGQSILDVINIFLGGGVSQEPRAFKPRFILLVWMFGALILRNAYHGALFEILQSQIRYQPVDTTDRIVEYNYTFYVSPVAYDMLYHGIPILRNQLSAQFLISFVISIDLTNMFSILLQVAIGPRHWRLLRALEK